jgi:hypothetical protein
MKEFSFLAEEYGDDLRCALQNNSPKTFNPEDITHIVAEVCGENDELAWWWILKMNNGKFFLLSGSCDYTGWDCQSGINERGFFNTPLQAAKASPEKEEYGNRSIQLNLIRQVKGEQPLFTYVEENYK